MSEWPRLQPSRQPPPLSPPHPPGPPVWSSFAVTAPLSRSRAAGGRPSAVHRGGCRAPRRPLTFEGEPDPGRGRREVLDGGGWPGPGHEGSPEEETSHRHRGRPGPRKQLSGLDTWRAEPRWECEAERGSCPTHSPRLECRQGPQFPRLNKQGAGVSSRTPSAWGLSASSHTSCPFSAVSSA